MTDTTIPLPEPPNEEKTPDPLDELTDSLLRGGGVLGLSGALILGAVTLLLLLKPETGLGVRSLGYVAVPVMGLSGLGFLGLAAWHLMKAFVKLEQWLWPNGSPRTQSSLAFALSCIIAVSTLGLMIAALLSLHASISGG